MICADDIFIHHPPWRGWCARLWLSHVELLKLHHRARRRRAAEWRFVLTQSKEFTTTPQQMCGAEKTWPCHRLWPITSSHGQGEQWCHHVVWFRLGLTSSILLSPGCRFAHHPCQKWHIYLTSPVVETHIIGHMVVVSKFWISRTPFYEKPDQFQF